MIKEIKKIYNIHSKIEVGMKVTVTGSIVEGIFANNGSVEVFITEIEKCSLKENFSICSEGCLGKRIGINGLKPKCMIYSHAGKEFRTRIISIEEEKDFISENEMEL